MTVLPVGSVEDTVAPLVGLVVEGVGALDRLGVPVGLDATGGVVPDEPETGLVKLMADPGVPVAEASVEPAMFEAAEPGLLPELLGTVELVVEPIVLEPAVAVLAMPCGEVVEAAAGLLDGPEAETCAPLAELGVTG